MKRSLFATAISIAAFAAPAFAADVGVSITIGHPDFFGRIELGNVAPPPVVYERPVIIERAPHYEHVEPIYLRVPPGHAKDWKRYCARYDACGRPVYFVKDDWYRNVYAPHYREEHREYLYEERRAEELREERREEERREALRREEHHAEYRDEHHDKHHDQHHENGNDHHGDERDH